MGNRLISVDIKILLYFSSCALAIKDIIGPTRKKIIKKAMCIDINDAPNACKDNNNLISEKLIPFVI